jgi:hypothetical protein
MRATLTVLAFLLAPWGAARAGEAKPRRPNVVIILSDDQGWGDLSVSGKQRGRRSEEA